jgi:hypothetical protein
MCFAEEVVVARVAAAEALALRAHVLVDEDVLLLVAILSELLFPVDLLLHDLGSFHHRFSSSQVFLHEPQMLILNYGFDLFI